MVNISTSATGPRSLPRSLIGIAGSLSFGITPLPEGINGICYLYAALSIFKTGRIRHKGGSNATFVFVISSP